MKLRKSSAYIIMLGCCLVSLAVTGCRKDNSDETSAYRPGGTAELPTSSPHTFPTTAPDIELPVLVASNLTVPAGNSVDYLGNLVIEGAGDTEITQIYVNTSDVRYLVPGTYSATYSINFKGYTVLKTIQVTITEPADSSVTPTYAQEPYGTSIGDMEVTLLSGLRCSIPCTTEHFIVESYTDDSYTTLSGKNYRTSVLKVLFSDGETVELETAYSRIAD